jgi:heme-degrading monooxygenase HmoA
MRAKPGSEQLLQALMREEEARSIPGYVSSTVYRMDDDPNTYMLAVIFESREAYVANANSPEQDADYRKMLELLEGPPEWHDGEIITS